MKKSIATFVLAIALCSVPAIAAPTGNAMTPPMREFSGNQIRSFFSRFWWVFVVDGWMIAA